MSYINNINLYGYIGGGVFYSDMMMPDYKSKRIVLNPFLNNSWTADKTGFVSVSTWTTGTFNGGLNISIDDVAVCGIGETIADRIFPILKGSVIKLTSNARPVNTSILYWYDPIPFK